MVNKDLQHRGTEEAEVWKGTGGTRVRDAEWKTQTPTTRKGQRFCEERTKKIGLQILSRPGTNLIVSNPDSYQGANCANELESAATTNAFAIIRVIRG